MIVLALDTALGACSVALADGSSMLACRHEVMARGHAERLHTMIAEVMAEAGAEFCDIARIAVTRGPGTFTGLRIGLAAARGLAVALARPVVGVGTLDVLARNVSANPDRMDVAAVVDARRGQVYLQRFAADFSPLDEARAMEATGAGDLLSARPAILVGSGSPLVHDENAGCRIWPHGDHPDARKLAVLAQELDPASQPPEPFYLRKPDAKPQRQLVERVAARVEISGAGPETAGAMAALHARTFERGWTAGEFTSLLDSPGAVALIAADPGDGQVVGLVVARMAADEAEIITIATDPARRRRGIAARLLSAAVALVGAAGTEKVFLEVDADNQAGLALYRSAGFVRTGIRSGYYVTADGARSDAVVMVHAIAPG